MNAQQIELWEQALRQGSNLHRCAWWSVVRERGMADEEILDVLSTVAVKGHFTVSHMLCFFRSTPEGFALFVGRQRVVGKGLAHLARCAMNIPLPEMPLPGREEGAAI